MTLLDRFGLWIEALGARDQAYIDQHNPSQGTGYRRLARFVGLIAIGLPLGMWLVSAVSNECFYNSVSHYFYARWVGAVFVAALAFLGSFLIGYTGENALEGRVALIAGLLLIVVAVIPTGGVGCEDATQVRQVFAQVSIDQSPVLVAPTEAGEALSHFQMIWGSFGNLLIDVHFASAAIVLAIMAVFALVVFTRVNADVHIDGKTGRLLPGKSMRNIIYTMSGFMILCCIATIFWGNLPSDMSSLTRNWNALNLTFWFEALALFAFGFSWLLRGRFFGGWLVDKQEMDLIGVGDRC